LVIVFYPTEVKHDRWGIAAEEGRGGEKLPLPDQAFSCCCHFLSYIAVFHESSGVLHKFSHEKFQLLLFYGTLLQNVWVFVFLCGFSLLPSVSM